MAKLQPARLETQPVDVQALEWKMSVGGAPIALQRRKVLSLALVLELRRGRHDGSIRPLDRCGALGHEVRYAARGPDAGG